MTLLTSPSARSVQTMLLTLIIVLGTVPMPALGAGTTEVALTPSSQATGEGQTVTYEVVLTNASDGVGSWEFTASVNNTSAAKITDISLKGDPFSNETHIPEDGSSAYAKAIGADTADSGEVTIATITVRGVNEGPAGLSLSVEDVGDESSSKYEISSTPGATLDVENANFEYTNLEVTPQEANETANITATATVTNTGGTSGTVIVPLTVDGTEVANQTVSLAADESTEVSFSHELGEPGDYEIAIDDTSPVTVSVNAPPNANVTASPTDAGVNETVTVSATNSTDADGTVDSFRWDVGSGRIVNDNGGQLGVQFSEPGQHWVNVTVVDDDGATDSESVLVNVTDGTGPTAVLGVNESSVVINGTVRATASGSDDNVGVVAYDWSVEAPDGEVTTYTGEKTIIPVTQDGMYTVTLTVTDGGGNEDSTTTTVEGLAPASFTTTQEVNTTRLLTNESVKITATVSNNGDVAGTTDVNLTVNDNVEQSQSVEVAAGGSETVTFTTSLSRGEHTVAVNDNDPVTVTALAPANLTIQSVDAPSEVVQGATATVNATVENVGDTNGSRDVTLTVGDESTTTTVTVPAGETKNVSLQVPTTDTPAGPIDYEVTTSTYTATGSITIFEPANTSISYELNTTEPLTNESLQVSATVTNTGDVEGDAPVTLYVDDETRDSKTVTVGARSSKTVTFNVSLERGDHTVRVNERESRTVTALSPPNLTVGYSVNTTSILTNESAAVTATIENAGDLTGSTMVNFTVNGAVVASETVTVAGESTETVTYVPELSRGANTVAVNDKEPQTVEVHKPADISIVAQNVTTEEFLSTNPLNVTVYLNNTGDLNGTTTVPLYVDSETVATKTVSVQANTVGETNSDLKAVQFSVERNWETYGDHTVRAGELSEEAITVLWPTNPDTTVEMVSPTSGTVQNSSDVTIEYTVENASTGVSAIEMQIDGGEWQEPLSSSVQETLADGEHTARVRVIDNLGNTIATAKTTFTVDTHAPDVSVQTDGPASPNSPADITVTSKDLTQNTTVVEIRDDGTTISRTDVSDEVNSETDGANTSLTTWNGTNQSGAAVPSGTYTVAVISTDEAGNTNETTTTVVADTDRPQVNVTDVQAGDRSGTTLYVNETDELTITLETSDPTTSVISTSALVRSQSSSFQAFASASETATNGEWTATVDVSELGGSRNYSVGGLATDEAQNVRPRYNDTVTIVVDETSPAMGATVSQADQSTGRVNITSSEPLTSAPDATVRLPNGTTQTVTLSETARGWTGTFSLPEDGSYQVTVSGTDRAGNTGETQASTNIQTNINTNNNTATVRNEETGTYIELHTENDVNKAFAALTESDSPLATLSQNLTGSQFIDGELGKQLNDNLTYAVIGMPVNESQLPKGVEPEDVEIRFYNETTGEWEKVGETNITERESNGTTQRFYTVNVSHFSTYGAVATDDTAPSLSEPSLSPTGSPYAYDTETASVQFNYSDSQSGVDTSEVKVWVDGELVTDSQSPDTTVQVTSDTTVVELTDLVGSGDHSVTVNVVDEAGNTASNASKTFTVQEDTTSPTVTTDFASGTTFDYGTSQVEFQFDLSDTQSSVDPSGVTVTVDGVDVTDPATVTENGVSYTATDLDAGSHNFTVVVPDEEGNVKTVTRTFTIEADTDAPTIDTASVSPTSDSGLLPANTTKLTLSTEYSDVESGVVASNVGVEFNDGSGWTDVTDTAVVTRDSTSYTAYDLTPGTYSFRVTVQDAAGNTNSITKQVTIGEGTAPSFTGVDISPDSDPLPANTSEVTVDIGFTDSEGDYDSIDAQFDGESVSVVRNDGEVSYTATGLEAGTNHTFTVTVTDRGGHTITKTVSLEIAAKTTSNTDSSGSGGGGGGGGGSSESTALSLNVIPVSDGVTVQVRDTANGATGIANLGDAASGDGVSVNSIGLAMKFDSSRFRVEVSTPTADGPSTPEGTTISSFSMNAVGVKQSKLDSQTITFTVDESALPDGASMDDIALFVKTDSGWKRVSVSQNGGTFTAETDTLGTFAVTALTDAAGTSTETSTTTTTSDTESVTATQTDQEETSQTTETDSPGLGITQAILALAAALLVIRRWSG